MPVKPITPKEALTQHDLPDKVIETWNRMITKAVKSNGVIYQNHIISELIEVMDVSRNTVISRGWLDVENIYRNVGFEVSYQKGSYDGDDTAKFTFKVPLAGIYAPGTK